MFLDFQCSWILIGLDYLSSAKIYPGSTCRLIVLQLVLQWMSAKTWCVGCLRNIYAQSRRNTDSISLGCVYAAVVENVGNREHVL